MERGRVLDLRSSDLRADTADVVARHGRGDRVFGTYFFRNDEPEADLARQVEQVVFMEAFGNTPELLAAEYGPYERSSLFVCVIDHRRSLPVGSMRVLLPSGPHKSLDDIEGPWNASLDEVLVRTGIDIDRAATWDLATLAVDPSYRDGTVRSALFQGVNTASLLTGAKWYVAILDIVVLRMIQSCTSRIFSRYAGVDPMRYLDSVSSLPVYSDLEAYLDRLRREDPHSYELMWCGKGLEPVVSLPDWADVEAKIATIVDGASMAEATAGR
jgi:hypothetical protein